MQEKKEIPTTATPSCTTPEFAIPLDLMKSFKEDVRFASITLNTKGFILFDRAMLVDALLSSNVEERRSMAMTIKNMKADLVIVEPEQIAKVGIT